MAGRPRIPRPRNILSPPTMKEIISAAMFYEAEGHFRIDEGLPKVKIGQNSRERLDWFVTYFGGIVYDPTEAGSYTWSISGDRALGFIYTVFSLVCRTEKDRIKSVLAGLSAKKEYNPIQLIMDRGFIHEFPAANTTEDWEMPSLTSYLGKEREWPNK